MPRLFIALELPDAVKDALMRMCAGVPGAKWRKHEQLHLTLRFIGEVDGGIARDIAEALTLVRAPGFELALRGIGHFGDGRRPRVLWAGVDAAEPVRFLHDRIERVLGDVGLPSERRKFRPHVTLARLNGVRMHHVTEFESHFGGYRSPGFPVHGFTLFSSFLYRDGAIYTPEADYPLVPAQAHSGA